MTVYDSSGSWSSNCDIEEEEVFFPQDEKGYVNNECLF